MLAFSDKWSGTKQTFRVIAFEEEAVILAQIGGDGEADPKRGPGGKGGGRFPGGGFGGGRNPRQGPAEPLAVVAGNIAVAIPKKVEAALTYYRWPLGWSLKEVVNPDPKTLLQGGKNPCQLSDTEVKKILQRVAESGPLASREAALGN